tara:strand:- start:814 stop:1179 length:366 start_codon:yes stop_codon:yes gene_type:complete
LTSFFIFDWRNCRSVFEWLLRTENSQKISSPAPNVYFFDQYEVGYAGQSKVVEFKCKEKVSKMPLNIYRMGLALGVSRTWRDTLLEQLLGSREEPEPFLLTTEEPIAKPSIKSRLLSNLVA